MRSLSLLLGLLLWVMADAAELGRLFTTPAQREQLQQGVTEEGGEARGSAPRQEVIQVQGILKRRGGEAIIWIDGQAVPKGRDANGTRVLDASPRRVVIHRPELRDPVTLKPGQRVGPKGEVREPYEVTAPEPAQEPQGSAQ